MAVNECPAGTAFGEQQFKQQNIERNAVKTTGVDAVDNADYGGVREKEARIKLTAGKHPVSIFYYENKGTERMDMEIVGPGIERQTLPQQMLFISVR